MIEVAAVDSPVSLLWVAHDEGTIVASTLAGSTHSPTFTPYLDLPLARETPRRDWLKPLLKHLRTKGQAACLLITALAPIFNAWCGKTVL